jgi:hypothetical protein
MHDFALKSSFFRSLGACRLTKRVLLLVLGLGIAASLASCGYSAVQKPPSGQIYRVMAAQSATSASATGGLIIVSAQHDLLLGAPELSTGASPDLLAISPDRAVLAAFDASTNTVYGVNTAKESIIGKAALAGPTWSMVVPTSATVSYAAVPSATIAGYSFQGAVQEVNFSTSSLMTTMAVTNAEIVVSNADGSLLLVFSNDSNSVTLLSPSLASPPVDTSCLTNPQNPVCTIIPGFDRPVYAIVQGNTAYIFNCGAECGGKRASIQTLNLVTLAVGVPVPVNGATWGLISGNLLYVAGNGTPTGPLCSSLPNASKTAATYCGTLDIIDLTKMTDPYYNNPSKELAITDGYHYMMDMSANGQLFVGSYNCTNVGDVNNPVGEVRGCLAIYNTSNGKVIIPPDNGDVYGLQGFSTRDAEYVAQGGNLRVYDTTIDALWLNYFIPLGTVPINGFVSGVKAVDFF